MYEKILTRYKKGLSLISGNENKKNMIYILRYEKVRKMLSMY